jgi:hypothetical protein
MRDGSMKGLQNFDDRIERLVMNASINAARINNSKSSHAVPASKFESQPMIAASDGFSGGIT